MVSLTTHNLKLIAGKRGIKNYQNMSREKLLGTLDESERIFENLSQNGLEWIAKMQNPKWTETNHKNAEFIAKWTRANRKNETH